MRTIVVGLGNPVLSDDSVGLRVARELRSHLSARNDVVVDEDYHGGLRLMERMIGYDRSIVVDATCTGLAPGTVHRLALESIGAQHTASAHDASLSTALHFGRRVGVPLPAADDVLLVGIEAADVSTFGESCTPEVEAAIPDAVRVVLEALVEQ